MKALDPPSDRFDRSLLNTTHEIHVEANKTYANHFVVMPALAAEGDSQINSGVYEAMTDHISASGVADGEIIGTRSSLQFDDGSIDVGSGLEAPESGLLSGEGSSVLAPPTQSSAVLSGLVAYGNPILDTQSIISKTFRIPSPTHRGRGSNSRATTPKSAGGDRSSLMTPKSGRRSSPSSSPLRPPMIDSGALVKPSQKPAPGLSPLFAPVLVPLALKQPSSLADATPSKQYDLIAPMFTDSPTSTIAPTPAITLSATASGLNPEQPQISTKGAGDVVVRGSQEPRPISPQWRQQQFNGGGVVAAGGGPAVIGTAVMAVSTNPSGVALRAAVKKQQAQAHAHIGHVVQKPNYHSVNVLEDLGNVIDIEGLKVRPNSSLRSDRAKPDIPIESSAIGGHGGTKPYNAIPLDARSVYSADPTLLSITGLQTIANSSAAGGGTVGTVVPVGAPLLQAPMPPSHTNSPTMFGGDYDPTSHRPGSPSIQLFNFGKMLAIESPPSPTAHQRRQMHILQQQELLTLTHQQQQQQQQQQLQQQQLPSTRSDTMNPSRGIQAKEKNDPMVPMTELPKSNVAATMPAISVPLPQQGSGVLTAATTSSVEETSNAPINPLYRPQESTAELTNATSHQLMMQSMATGESEDTPLAAPATVGSVHSDRISGPTGANPPGMNASVGIAIAEQQQQQQHPPQQQQHAYNATTEAVGMAASWVTTSAGKLAGASFASADVAYKFHGHLLNTTAHPEEMYHLTLHGKSAPLPQYLRVVQTEQQQRKLRLVQQQQLQQQLQQQGNGASMVGVTSSKSQPAALPPAAMSTAMDASQINDAMSAASPQDPKTRDVTAAGLSVTFDDESMAQSLHPDPDVSTSPLRNPAGAGSGSGTGSDAVGHKDQARLERALSRPLSNLSDKNIVDGDQIEASPEPQKLQEVSPSEDGVIGGVGGGGSGGASMDSVDSVDASAQVGGGSSVPMSSPAAAAAAVAAGSAEMATTMGLDNSSVSRASIGSRGSGTENGSQKVTISLRMSDKGTMYAGNEIGGGGGGGGGGVDARSVGSLSSASVTAPATAKPLTNKTGVDSSGTGTGTGTGAGGDTGRDSPGAHSLQSRLQVSGTQKPMSPSTRSGSGSRRGGGADRVAYVLRSGDSSPVPPSSANSSRPVSRPASVGSLEQGGAAKVTPPPAAVVMDDELAAPNDAPAGVVAVGSGGLDGGDDNASMTSGITEDGLTSGIHSPGSKFPRHQPGRGRAGIVGASSGMSRVPGGGGAGSVTTSSFSAYAKGASAAAAAANSGLPPNVLLMDNSAALAHMQLPSTVIGADGGAVDELDPTMPLQLHKRMMGWKLTSSVQRHRNLVGMLDVVHNNNNTNNRNNSKKRSNGLREFRGDYDSAVDGDDGGGLNGGLSSAAGGFSRQKRGKKKTFDPFLPPPGEQMPLGLLRTGRGQRTRHRDVPPIQQIRSQLNSIEEQQSVDQVYLQEFGFDASVARKQQLERQKLAEQQQLQSQLLAVRQSMSSFTPGLTSVPPQSHPMTQSMSNLPTADVTAAAADGSTAQHGNMNNQDNHNADIDNDTHGNHAKVIVDESSNILYSKDPGDTSKFVFDPAYAADTTGGAGVSTAALQVAEQLRIAQERQKRLQQRQSAAWHRYVSKQLKLKQNYTSPQAIRSLMDERIQKQKLAKELLRQTYLEEEAILAQQQAVLAARESVRSRRNGWNDLSKRSVEDIRQNNDLVKDISFSVSTLPGTIGGDSISGSEGVSPVLLGNTLPIDSNDSANDVVMEGGAGDSVLGEEAKGGYGVDGNEEEEDPLRPQIDSIVSRFFDYEFEQAAAPQLQQQQQQQYGHHIVDDDRREGGIDAPTSADDIYLPDIQWPMDRPPTGNINPRREKEMERELRSAENPLAAVGVSVGAAAGASTAAGAGAMVGGDGLGLAEGSTMTAELSLGVGTSGTLGVDMLLPQGGPGGGGSGGTGAPRSRGGGGGGVSGSSGGIRVSASRGRSRSRSRGASRELTGSSQGGGGLGPTSPVNTAGLAPSSLSGSRSRSRGKGLPSTSLAEDLYNYPTNINRTSDRMDILQSVQSRSMLEDQVEKEKEQRLVDNFIKAKYGTLIPPQQQGSHQQLHPASTHIRSQEGGDFVHIGEAPYDHEAVGDNANGEKGNNSKLNLGVYSDSLYSEYLKEQGSVGANSVGAPQRSLTLSLPGKNSSNNNNNNNNNNKQQQASSSLVVDALEAMATADALSTTTSNDQNAEGTAGVTATAVANADMSQVGGTPKLPLKVALMSASTTGSGGGDEAAVLDDATEISSIGDISSVAAPAGPTM